MKIRSKHDYDKLSTVTKNSLLSSESAQFNKGKSRSLWKLQMQKENRYEDVLAENVDPVEEVSQLGLLTPQRGAHYHNIQASEERSYYSRRGGS